jgi:hypothetical protein
MDFVSGPPTRLLTVLAQDPSVTKDGKAVTAQVAVPTESLAPGPKGHRVHVIDFDVTRNLFFPPRSRGLERDGYADTTDPDRLVADRHFHAQNVYGLVSTTLLQFEMAMGRHVTWAFPSGSHYIKVAPHAFAEANAYYSRRDEGIVFGYVPIVAPHGGRQWPKFVFTCLSSDIVVHETAHALLDGLRSEYMRPSTPDQPAFHEGFADIVALLSSLSRKELIDLVLPATRRGGRNLVAMRELTVARLRGSVLLGLAEQFGATVAQRTLRQVRPDALRRSVALNPRTTNYRILNKPGRDAEPHELGEILVAAVMNAFLAIWTARIAALDPTRSGYADRDRVAEEGAKTASHLLRIAIRAIDYMPPIHISFPDFLSALLTADHEAVPDDSAYGYRAQLLAGFARYQIAPASANVGGYWDDPKAAGDRLKYGFAGHAEMAWDREAMMRFLWENRAALEIDTDAFTTVNSVRPVVRVAPSGFVLRETVVEYFQLLDIEARELKGLRLRKPSEMPNQTPVRLLGGGTLIFDDYGRLKFHIGSGVRSQLQNDRVASLWAHRETGHEAEGARRFERLHRLRAIAGGAPKSAGW